jgi:hypothetical protein
MFQEQEPKSHLTAKQKEKALRTRVPCHNIYEKEDLPETIAAAT